MAVSRNFLGSAIVTYLYLFCCLSRSLIYLNTLIFCPSYALDDSGVTKTTNEVDLYRASCSSSMRLFRHLGFSSSTRSHRYFTARISHTPNSVSSFNLTRLRLTTSGDISPNPGPLITSFTTNRRAVKHRSHHHSHRSNVVQVNRVSDLHLSTSNTQLTMCTLNARSISNKSALFVDYVSECKADLVAITETWLSDNDSAVCYEITPAGYKLLHCPRGDRRGGGTALLFRDNINVSKLETVSRISFESSEYLVCTGSLRFRLAIIYRPPYSVNHPVTVNSFIDEFSEYLESVILSNDVLCLTGDFNIHVDDHNDSAACRFLDLLESMSLTQHVTEPTHELGHTLDLVITRKSDNLISGRPAPDILFSDHLALLFKLKTPRPPLKVGRVSFRKLRSIDKSAFADEICNSELLQTDTEDPDELAALFNNTLRSLLDRHAPVKQKNVTIRSRVPWMNDEIILAKRQRRKAERKWRASKAHIDLLSYRAMRNRVTFLSNEARCAYYTNFITENSTDQRRLFRASKSLLNLSNGPGLPLSTNDYQLANDFGKFFAQKIADIKSVIANQSRLPVTIDAASTVTASCFSEFTLLSESEVFDLIKASSKKSCLLDPIPTKLLTDFADVLLPPITKIINLSLDSGYFPRTWKSALVRPLLKKDGLPLVFKNYRPVSNLAFISKLVETVVAKQLQHYLNGNNLFPVFQSAYRQNHSTETALLKVMNDILLNMNSQRVTLLILLDLSAAFDTVDHDTMLRRLESSFGIHGKALSWFTSYLSGRTQRIMINDSLSEPFKLECGVPQGSCLGPLLFSLYTSKLFEIIEYHLPTIHCYADDSQVYISFSPNDRAEQLAVVRSMEDCIRDIRLWMLNNDLKLNDDKTEFLIIGTSQQLGKLDNISIRVGDSDIHPVPIARNLGSWFDSRLSMATHITKICASSFYYIYNIRRIRKYLSQQSTETLVHAFITSRLDYCNGLLYGLPDCLLNKLQRVQNACARLILKEQRFCHITPLIFKLHWLPIRYRIEFKILLITFKILNFLAPSYLSSLISLRPPSKYNLRNSSDKLLLSHPSFKSKATLGDRSFTCAAPKLWNELPLDIRSARTVNIFKTKLKTHLMEFAHYKF